MPANGSITCIYAAPLQSTQGGTNAATAVGSLNGVDVSDTGTAIFTFSETPNYEINKTVKAVDGKNTWSDIDGTSLVHLQRGVPVLEPGSDERRRPARRQPVDRAGRDGLQARHGLGERDGALQRSRRLRRRLRLRRR